MPNNQQIKNAPSVNALGVKKCPVSKCPWDAHLNEDLQFLVHCCKTNPSEDDIKKILSYLNTKDLDINTLIGSANTHGVLPLVYLALKTNSSSPHNAILFAFKQQYLSIAQRNMLMSAELIHIMKLLKVHNIKALAFKGPALAQMAYGDITLRQFGDLDILIKKEDIKKVEALCLSMGYLPYLKLTEVQKEVWYTYAKDMVFYHPQKKSVIEIHWLLLDADFPLQMDLNDIWEQTNSVGLNKIPVGTFALESLLLYLCVHGSKHLWERIVWIKDIDMMIRTQNIDLDKVLIDAKKNDLMQMLLLGLYLSKKLFDTPLPKNIEESFKHEKILPELSNFVFKNWETQQSMFPNTKAMLKFFPKLKMKALYLHKVILKPSKNEYMFIDLPKGLYWVYYFVRPYLLIKKYVSKN